MYCLHHRLFEFGMNVSSADEPQQLATAMAKREKHVSHQPHCLNPSLLHSILKWQVEKVVPFVGLPVFSINMKSR